MLFLDFEPSVIGINACPKHRPKHAVSTLALIRTVVDVNACHNQWSDGQNMVVVIDPSMKTVIDVNESPKHRVKMCFRPRPLT